MFTETIVSNVKTVWIRLKFNRKKINLLSATIVSRMSNVSNCSGLTSANYDKYGNMKKKLTSQKTV